MAPEAFRQRSAPVGGSKPLLSLLRADAEHGGAHRAVTASPLAVVVRLHPSALTPRRGTRPSTLPTSSTRAGTRARGGSIGGRRPRPSLRPPPRPGDEVLLEERLACTEEERVRPPPSPLPLRKIGIADARIPIARIPEAGCFAARSRCPSHPICLRSVNGKHAPFVRPRCGFNSCRRLLRTPVAQRTRALPCEGRGRWFDSSRAYPRGRSSSGQEHRSATSERPVRAGPSALVDSWCNGSTPSSNLGDPGSNPGESAARPRRGPERVGYLMDRRVQALAVRSRGPDRIS